MEKLDGKSMDIVSENIAKLKELFPDVFSEEKVNFEALEATLGEYVDTKEERYNFNWNGKAKARRIAQTPSTGTLRPAKEESKNWDSTENLYIEGDNLEVLKLLQKSYHKQVKMIYIDPPYNTGKDFVYKDNFKDNLQNYLEITGQMDSEGNKLSTNSDASGRYHSNWLNMMYPRLKLARNLLKDDGIIFVSIDDNEVANLRKICDEIFGEANLIAQTVRASNSTKNNSNYLSVTHDYTLIYAKSKEYTKKNWQVHKRNVKNFQTIANRMLKQKLPLEEIESELRALVKYPKYYDFDHYYYCDKKGVYRTDNAGGVDNGNYDTKIFHPITQKECKKPARGWRYNENTINEMLNKEMFKFGEDENTIPLPKRYLEDYLTTVPSGISFFDTQIDTNLFKEIEIPFDFPKPYEYMKYLLEMEGSKDGIVLDFFSGSSTTAHAVMDLNIQDNGNRQYICVQLPERTPEKSKAHQMKYKNICEIGKERIRRVGEKLKADNIDKDLSDLDIGFKVFKLDSSNIKTWDPESENLEQSLFEAVNNIKSDRKEEDILYEILLKYGLDLTLPIEELELAGKKVYVVGLGALVICLDEQITLDTVEEIAKLKEQYESDDLMRVVFRDNGFKDAEVKTNAIQILKQSGIDDVKSL